MKTLFTTDYKNYEANWQTSSRPSARAIIIVKFENQESQERAGSSGSADASENPDSIPLSQNEGGQSAPYQKAEAC